MLDTWEHSGFTVFCGNRIYPHDDTAMENLARYIIRDSCSLERMTYLRDESKIIYRAKKTGRQSLFHPSILLKNKSPHITAPTRIILLKPVFKKSGTG
jgi:hypothetical protein